MRVQLRSKILILLICDSQGAIREIRKDVAFLAKEKLSEQRQL